MKGASSKKAQSFKDGGGGTDSLRMFVHNCKEFGDLESEYLLVLHPVLHTDRLRFDFNRVSVQLQPDALALCSLNGIFYASG